MSNDAASETSMDLQRIMEYLPHRYPFLLVDRVIDCRPGESIECIKNVTINEPFFSGHFPKHAVMPGVLLIEAMAQACGLLAFRTREAQPHGPEVTGSSLFFLVGVDGAKFKRRVEPGDQVVLRAAFKRSVRGIWLFDASAMVDERIAAQSEIRCTMREV